MKADLQEGYANAREQRWGGILALAWELGRRPLQREIAAALDISRSYACSLLLDPDGAKERERKSRYAGVCDKCGGPTSGGDGRAKAPTRCRSCIQINPAAPRVGVSRPIWNEQKCLDSIVRWIERHRRIPRVNELTYAEPGERPCWGTIVRHCYRYEPRRTSWVDSHGETRTEQWPRLVYAWPDILVDLAPRLPADAVVSARNAFLRARLFEVVGIENIVTTAGRKVATDDYGTLWRIERDEWRAPVVMVQVLNSTPEPDGSFRDYFLRVPPDTQTPRQGIAWTFDVETHEYQIAVAT